jgi:hypothetical protein
MKFQGFLILITLVSLGLAAYFFTEWLEKKKENNRINNNFSAAINELKAENYNNNLVYQMSVREIKNSFPDLEKKLKQEFDVKLKNLIQYTQTNIEVNHPFKAPVKTIDWDKLGITADSVINAILKREQEGLTIDTIKLKTFSFNDAWLDFNAVEIDDTVYVDRNKMPVPLDQIVHRDKFRLKYLFKNRPLFQQIKSDNPHAEIKYNRVIQVTK